ncbi:hypothetical protein [Sphingobium sp. Z007]|uniref:hypothetical protein n=1 Tax=Sphingobium sp. Z007 TaxID=627495 RepID=UPI0011250C6C|nr:hypothetical protein [Sphingobium sp. Z007]
MSASNGVEVSVNSDEFAGRHEYTAPLIKLPDGFVLVAGVKKAGISGAAFLTGYLAYIGEWRRYSSALYRGGNPAKFTNTSREVGRCHSSRYSRPTCTLSEGFKIEVSAEDIRQHAQNGTLSIQVRADDTSTVMLEVPVSYFDAVNEMLKR